MQAERRREGACHRFGELGREKLHGAKQRRRGVLVLEAQPVRVPHFGGCGLQRRGRVVLSERDNQVPHLRRGGGVRLI